MDHLRVQPMEWAALPDIDAVEPVNAADETCLGEVYEVLKRHGKANRFGISLIHRHFPVGEDEVLIETCHDETRTLTLKAVKANSAEAKRSVPTNWILAEDSGAKTMSVCLRRCFRNVQGNHSDAGHYSS